MRLSLGMTTFVAVLALAPSTSSARPTLQDNWPQWRGPGGLGVAANASLPLNWNATDNVLWKAPIEGRGLSSPIVWGDRIFLTTAVQGNVVPGAAAPVHLRHGFWDVDPDLREPYVHPDSMGADRAHTLKILAFDTADGRLVWERTVWDGPVYDNRHRAGSYASATPVTDGDRVYAWFGSQGLFAFDFDGTLAWSFDAGDLPNWGLGHGTSPLLVADVVVLVCDRDNGDDSFMVALDAVTGAEVWRTRRLGRTNWSTPLILGEPGREQLVTSGFQWSGGYDPATGEELWRVRGLYGNVIATPVGDTSTVFLSVGFPDKRTQAVALESRGLLHEDDLVWQYNKGTAYVPSNLLLGEYLYLIDDRATLTCLNAQTGGVVYEGGRVPLPTRFAASPVAYGDKILLSGQDGDMFVVQAGPEHSVLATNSLGETLWASPAIVGDRLYVRGDQHLFAIGEQSASVRFEVPDTSGMRWFKGNTHTHTDESDGDSPPELVVQWYREHGYDFLVLTDHNVFTDPQRLAHLQSADFILIPGEEVSTSYGAAAIHVNGLNIGQLVEPQQGSSIVDTIQRNVDAIREVQGVPHLNHPNFLWSYSAEQIAEVENDRLLEIYNGHPRVHNDGGGGAPSMEAVWDTLLTRGRRIYGIAVDDAHAFQSFGPELSNPGRAWIAVRSRGLAAAEIMANLEAGLFYASTGVVLEDIVIEPYRLEVHIARQGDFKYTTKFIGANGRELASTYDHPAVFELRTAEPYVRALVVDSGGKRAWVQPVFTQEQ